MIDRLKSHPGQLTKAQLSDTGFVARLNRMAPLLIMLFVFGLAGLITLDEWRSGTMGSSPIAASRDLVFARQADGSMTVKIAETRALVTTLPNAEEGFVAMTIKSMTRERNKFNVADTEPYRLSRLKNGRLSLTDPVTGTRIELVAFGVTNIGAFAQLLTTEPQPSKLALN
jgi:putative photosynthetic complex assembly protein